MTYWGHELTAFDEQQRPGVGDMISTPLIVAAVIAFAAVFALQLFRGAPRDQWGNRHITGRAVFFAGLSAALVSLSILFLVVTVVFGIVLLVILVFGLFAHAAV
ncbi:hypothetical protein [Williamsia sp. 1135]|uniref:hypothetical protein n=1 Tax=Williamsia sp. 1135 TaxID=1889262 RepID=UPI000A21AB9E|nr:hypothetical protein [Williamsia sp. 1135]ORM37782.1 hypothetical protein BFL43_02995 [Williamsia sp. 1135]